MLACDPLVLPLRRNHRVYDGKLSKAESDFCAVQITELRSADADKIEAAMAT